MNNAFEIHMTTDYALKSGSGTIRDYFCINLAIPFEQTENNVFSTTSDSPNATRAEVTFVDFDFPLNRRLRFTIMSNSFPQGRYIPIDGITIDTG